jgi:hypothetical protein
VSAAGRLLVVGRADPSGRYGWLPRQRAGDVTVVLDEPACADLADRQAQSFDQLQSWEQRSAAEDRVAALLGAIASHPAVSAIEHDGLRLIDFAEYRLRTEVARLLRGWTLARAAVGVQAAARVQAAAGAQGLVCDPALAPATVIGVRAALGLDPRVVPYTLPAALPGSAPRRAVAHRLMRALAALSRPRDVRLAVVAAGKLSLALAALPGADLRAAGVGVLPFPGLDHGNGLLLALRKRLALLGPSGREHRGAGVPVSLPPRLRLESDGELDRALAILVGRVMAAAAPELDLAVGALRSLDSAPALRALLLPSAAYGASRLLIEWAHGRGLCVAAMQHGIYISRELDGGDRRADVILGWACGTAEQIAGWPEPRPLVRPVGVPGLDGVRPAAGIASPAPSRGFAEVRRVLLATSNTVEAPLAPVGFCEAFLDALAPGVQQLARAGVEIELRPHPSEEPELYRRMLAARGLEVKLAWDGPFQEALASVDILIASASSVAFEAAALGLPLLLWPGPAPRWVREKHLVAPWTLSVPGMFTTAEELCSLVADLIERPAVGLHVAQALSSRLAGYAEPFHAARFAAALHELGALADPSPL